MTRFTTPTLSALLLAATASLSVAQAADETAKPRSRAEVLAELVQARANGEMNFAEREVLPEAVARVQTATALAAAKPTAKTPSAQ